MLKYYSYYNVGGYKDMFLGDSSMEAQKTYYLPLLAIWNKKALAGDTDAEAKVKSAEGLTKIQLLSSKENLGLPKEAESMFSHGGYKVIYSVGQDGDGIFAIRDIESSSKDESGRTTPFLLVIVGTTFEDSKSLEKVAAYTSSHLESFSKELSALFRYDANINGIVFELAQMNTIVRKIAAEGNNSLLTTDGVKSIESRRGAIPLLVIPEGISKEVAFAEQGLKGKPVHSISIGQILPLKKKEKLIAALKNIKDVKNSIYSDRRVQCIVGGAVILGFIAGFLIGRS